VLQQLPVLASTPQELPLGEKELKPLLREDELCTTTETRSFGQRWGVNDYTLKGALMKVDSEKDMWK